MSRWQVIITGGQSFAGYALLERKCDALLINRQPTAILSGLARGADSLGVLYARSRGIEVKAFPANWERHKKRAGMIGTSHAP